MKQRVLSPGMPLPAFRSEQIAPLTVRPNIPEKEDERDQRLIDVLLIDPNPLAPREIYTPKMIGALADALRAQGQHDPVHVIPNPEKEGRFVICDGWTRVLACVEYKVLPALLAEVHADLSMQEAAWYGYQQNEERNQFCDLDRAMFYEKLIVQGASASEVARRAKLSKSLMSFYRAYAKLPEQVLEIVREHPAKFGSLAAYHLLKLHDQCGVRRTVALSVKFAEEDHPRAWLVNQVQLQLNPSPQKSPIPAKHIRYSNGLYKQVGAKFEVSIRVAEAQLEAFAAALESLLETVAERKV